MSRKIAGAALLLLYLGLAIAFSRVTPFNKGPDEGYHLEYITFLKQKGRLPISYEERAQITRADFPPLYHLLVAALSANLSVEEPPGFKLYWDSFRYRVIDTQNEKPWLLDTEDYQPPYLGRFLVWQMGRWLSIGLSVATLVITFLTLRELSLPPWLALFGTFWLAFIPQFLFLSASLNDDNLLAVLAALYFWLLVKIIKAPEKRRPFALAGIALGLALTVKYTLIVGLLELGLIALVLARKKGRLIWQHLGLAAGLMVLVSSWWFGWNLWFLNTIAQDGWRAGLLKPLLAGGSDTTLNRLGGVFTGGQIGLSDLPENTSIGAFPDWVRVTFLSFWGVSIGDGIPLSPYAYVVIVFIIGLAVIGLGRLWRLKPASHRWLLLMGFHGAIFIVLPLIRFGLSRRLGQTAQGRHILIPSAVAVIGLLVWGLSTSIPPRWQRRLLPLIIAGFIAWSALHLYRMATFTPDPLPMRTWPQAAEWLPQPVGARFGDSLELVSYGLDPQPAQGRLNLELGWRSLAEVKENYLLTIMLADQQGQVVSHWTGYNGQGRLPTLAWDLGDSVFDRIALPLPKLPAGDYSVQVQLSGSAGPLPVVERGDEEQGRRGAGEARSRGTEAQGDYLKLADVSLSQPAVLSLSQQLTVNNTPSPITLNFALWRSDGPVISNLQSPLPIYRYPATISIITTPPDDTTTMKVQLVDSSGQAWPATRQEANVTTFVIGPRWTSGDYRLRIEWQGDGANLGEAVSEPLLSVENWWPRRFDTPPVESPLAANFANQLTLLGYHVPHSQVKAGEAFPITLYWQALSDRAPQADFIQFNHLLDSAGTLRGGYDRRPLEYYSTLLWAAGETVVDGYTVPVNADAPPGQYYLSVGYYLTVGESAVNLPLVVEGQMSNASSVTIGPIEVVPP